MDDRYLQEFEEEIYQRTIHERKRAEKNIANLERCIRLYKSLNEGNLEQAKQLAERCLKGSYERARLHLKEIIDDYFGLEFRETYEPEYKKVITKAQKTIEPELFS